ncbi:MAG TPA: DUF3987 domain-containing protein [Xanthobacteraceae bacterium]|nr:DUF3987 domain-containing protein [Xanthobacteraceae bacterium]
MFDFATDLANLAVPVAPKKNNDAANVILFDPALFPKRNPTPSEDTDRLSEGIKREEMPPLGWEPLVETGGCAFIREALRTGGKDYSQSMWNLTTLTATFLADGEKLAHRTGNQHPTYTPGETRAMWERKLAEREYNRGLGWPSCNAIQAAGCTSCAGCKHFGKIRSPLNLARPQQTPHAKTPQQSQPEQPSFVDPYQDFVGPPFPLAVLPPTVAEFVKAEQRAMGADPSALAMAALTAVAGSLDAETCVRVADGWFEKPIIWTTLIGNPSTQKSPIIDKAVKPLREIDAERHQKWEQQFKLWKQQANRQQKQQTKLSTQPTTPPPPRPARCIINDSTAEKVAEILSRAPSGSLMVHDELAGWLESFERYSSGGSSRAFYLQSWNGGPHNKDRVGKGRTDENAEIFVKNLALSILGGIQPDRLTQMRDLTSDGLLQRGLPVLMRPAERGDENYPVADAEDKYNKLIASINGAKPEKVIFDDEARVVLRTVLDHLHRLGQVDGFSSALIGAIGKLNGYFARLCLVLHIAQEHDPVSSNERLLKVCPFPERFRRAEGERPCELLGGNPSDRNDTLSAGLGTSTAISRRTAEAAERIVREFLLPHIFGLYDGLNEGKERDKLRATASFILAFDKDRLRPSDFTEGVRSLRGASPKELGEWVGRFCALGWLRPEDDRYPAPKAWLVEPGLREHFAERRQQAQSARAEAHKILLAGGSRARDTVSDKPA